MPERLHRAGKSGTCQRSTWLGNPVSGSNVSLKNGEYRLLELKNRSGMQKMASVYVADLRQELKEGNRSILSRHLQELMEDRLEKQEQIMLFLNRRGYAGFLSCRECGHVVKCPHCDVSLSYHRNGKMVCHYCGYEEPRTPVCPECGSRHIGEFRAGTQQIEDIVKAQISAGKSSSYGHGHNKTERRP